MSEKEGSEENANYYHHALMYRIIEISLSLILSYLGTEQIATGILRTFRHQNNCFAGLRSRNSEEPKLMYEWSRDKKTYEAEHVLYFSEF